MELRESRIRCIVDVDPPHSFSASGLIYPRVGLNWNLLAIDDYLQIRVVVFGYPHVCVVQTTQATIRNIPVRFGVEDLWLIYCHREKADGKDCCNGNQPLLGGQGRHLHEGAELGISLELWGQRCLHRVTEAWKRGNRLG